MRLAMTYLQLQGDCIQLCQQLRLALCCITFSAVLRLLCCRQSRPLRIEPLPQASHLGLERSLILFALRLSVNLACMRQWVQDASRCSVALSLA